METSCVISTVCLNIVLWNWVFPKIYWFLHRKPNYFLSIY